MTDTLGAWLRRTREGLKLEIGKAETDLKIRKRYLQALEVGDYEALPSEIQVRGFLRNYARYLDLPIDDVIDRYEAEIHGHPIQPREAKPSIPVSSGRRSWAPPPPSAAEELASVRARSSRKMMQVVLGILLLFAVITIGSLAWLYIENRDAEPTVSSTTEIRETQQMEEADATLEPAALFPISADGKVYLRLVPQSAAWISVSSDGEVIFQGIAQTQQLLEAEAEQMLVVATGNGGAFQIYVNGTDWGLLGEQGEAVRRAWTPEGESAPEGE